MVRVYAQLKRRVMDGEFAPGARLDPARIRDGLAAGTTPIRDALHRPTGEGAVESWQNEGFRIPHFSEPAIQDCLIWCDELARLTDVPSAPSR
jgi:DNA-binding GntR family transcriptional regulator